MSKNGYQGPLESHGTCCWRIPKTHRPDMRVDGLIYAHESMLGALVADRAPEQVVNVATLPGIQKASLAMPDIHWGYGFAIGGVAATDPEEGGVISPGGVGYDINCGVRLLRCDLDWDDVKPRVRKLVDALFNNIPAGVGKSGRHVFSKPQLAELMERGAEYVVDELGMGVPDDLAHAEAGGRLEGAEPGRVSDRAYERGRDQCGTLGSGNHFLEVQVVDRIDDPVAAAALGLEVGRVTVLIHSGSRGLGYQVCEDHLAMFRNAPKKYGFELPDPQLACAPIRSHEGQAYLGAMRAAANYAWCNRQLLAHQTREVFAEVFGRPWESMGMQLVYDVAHNIAKFEDHAIDGAVKRVCVHRKGATRAFPPGHPELAPAHREIGQPVIIPGSMGTASWVLVGRPESMNLSFGTSCHGAGRAMSRTAAVRMAAGRRIDKELDELGVVVRARGHKGIAEEQPAAYKDVDLVVDVVDRVGISKKVARLRPVGVVKG